MSNNGYHVPGGYTFKNFSGTSEPDLMNQIGALRWQVWKRTGYDIELSIPDEHWFDNRDASSEHLAVVADDGTLIGATRVEWYESITHLQDTQLSDSIAQRADPPVVLISRLVVDQEYQGRGVGYFLDSCCIEIACSKGAQSILCDVPEYRIAGLQRRGFMLLEDPKPESTFPSIRWAAMMKQLH